MLFNRSNINISKIEKYNSMSFFNMHHQNCFFNIFELNNLYLYKCNSKINYRNEIKSDFPINYRF